MKTAVLRAARDFVVPNGLLVIAAVLLLRWKGLGPVTPGAIHIYALAVLGVGGVLAWRFHSSRTFLALVVLGLADRALAAGMFSPSGFENSRALFDLVCFLLPLNLALLGVLEEAGFTSETLGWGGALIFVQAVAVLVVARSERESVVRWFQRALIGEGTGDHGVPQWCLAAFLLAALALLVKWIARRKPVESGLFWSLAIALAGLEGTGTMRSAYLMTAGLVLIVSLIETSYLMAYHDELTGLPGRRALNQELLRLGEYYVIAMVDVDHFKKFNDTYGHETGDQVLRMVARRLAHVSGEGRAFRCGGEEFAVVFRSQTLKEALPHLEMLRQSIAVSSFMVRGPDRSRRKREERRKSYDRKRYRRDARVETAVTVSIGAAEPMHGFDDPEDVMGEADKALYRAKENGRNRTEAAGGRSQRSAPSAGRPRKSSTVGTELR